MELYIVIVISFALMYHIRYVRHALMCVEDTSSLLKLKTKIKYRPVLYSILTGIFVILFAPIPVFLTLVTPRQELVKIITSSTLKAFYVTEKSS